MQHTDAPGESGQGLAESEEKYRLISEVISDYTFSSKLNAQGKLEFLSKDRLCLCQGYSFASCRVFNHLLPIS